MEWHPRMNIDAAHVWFVVRSEKPEGRSRCSTAEHRRKQRPSTILSPP